MIFYLSLILLLPVTDAFAFAFFSSPSLLLSSSSLSRRIVFHRSKVSSKSRDSQRLQQGVVSLTNNDNVDDDMDREMVVAASSRRRREFLIASFACSNALLPIVTARATDEEEESLTSKMFNIDGSLKATTSKMMATSKTVSLPFPANPSTWTLAIDGSISALSSTTTTTTVQYKIPEKWTLEYLDTSEGSNTKACEGILVYSIPSSQNRLDKAANVGIAQTLGLSILSKVELLDKPPWNVLRGLASADLISARKVSKESLDYFEFDMAMAPATCSTTTSENLGLGFCPYQYIVLLSATMVEETNTMYVMVVLCDKDGWKRGNSDLKRVRDSFLVLP